MTITATPYSDLDKDTLYDILRLRSEVFLLEQHIVCQDMDGVDRDAIHVHMKDNGRVTGYLRVFKDGMSARIGRVAVAREHRGENFGAALMQTGIGTARKYFPGLPVKLHSQEQVVGFYEKCGFRVCSERFMEEGVPHFEMEYVL